MNSLPLPALVTALAAVVTLPFSIAAAGTLLMTAGLGAIIHADYPQRCRRLRLPKLATVRQSTSTRSALCCEPNRLAA